ncbi:MAG: DUF1028 domain-containing protein [Planctomycetota bacterium]
MLDSVKSLVYKLFDRPVHILAGLSCGTLALAAGNAEATWSVLIVDTRTGEIGLGSATCLTRLDLRELTPVLVAGSGAVTAQSAGDSDGFTRSYMRDRLLEGVPVADILDGLSQIDGAHQTRQYGMVDVSGGAVTFSGAQAGAWRGGLTGRAGDLVYAVQGNVLSGENVVADAAGAVVNTPGDIADKLLAAMVAAREAGGDGRCSCDPRNPEDCGSPPPAPFKSSHVGYMMIARAGDIDQSRAYYFDPRRPEFFAAADTNGDGFSDIIATVGDTSELLLATNQTVAGASMSHVTIDGVVDIGISGMRDIRTGDVTGDGVDDLVVIGASPAVVAVYEGATGEPFDLTTSARFSMPNPPSRMKLAQMDGDAALEIVVSSRAGGTVRVLEYLPDLSAVLESGIVAVPDGPEGIAIADFDGDELPDIAVTRFLGDAVELYRNTGNDGFLVFDPYASVPVDDQPIDVDAGDLNGDGVADLAVIHDGGETTRTFTNKGKAAFVPAQTFDIPNDGLRIDLVDVDADGLDDIVSFALSTQAAAQFLMNRGGGVFELGHEATAGAGQLSVLLTDLDNDGLPDYVSGSNRRGMTVMNNLGDGTFPLFNGFANGAYFMDLNVPDTLAGDPDPVDTLVQLFADWRATLDDRIDAVRTEVIAPSRVVAGAPFEARIVTRDYRGDALSSEVLGVSAEYDVGSGMPTASGLLEPGVVQASFIASPVPSDDSIAISIDDGSGPVRLMPNLEVMVLDSLADFDGSGVRDFFDIAEYLSAYAARDPAADITGDGVFDALDVLGFVQLFQAP